MKEENTFGKEGRKPLSRTVRERERALGCVAAPWQQPELLEGEWAPSSFGSQIFEKELC